MNYYIQSCKEKLKLIEASDYQEYTESVRDHIRSILSQSKAIVICGLTSVGRKVLQYVGRYSDAERLIYDIRDHTYNDEGLLKCAENRCYIICSREEALTYFDLIPKVGSQCLTYNEMLFLDDCFSVEHSFLHNHKYVCDCMKNVFEHAYEYIGMLESFDDVFSSELLARWLLYRLYMDVNVARGIQMKGKPYFDSEFVSVNKNEVFVDGGAYDGDTLSDFIEYSHNEFGKYYFFEPGSSVYHKAYKNYGEDDRIVFIKKALSSSSGSETYDTGLADVPEMIKSDEGDVVIDAVSLDELNIAPTFIKMDIEGAECDALDGAENTIRKYKPKLAICIYHKPNDILDIYNRIRGYGYRKLYIRAEKNTFDYDVVMYAVE